MRHAPRQHFSTARRPMTDSTRSDSAPPPVITVLAAIVDRNGRLLLSKRLRGTHLEGLWEFPGGKCEPGETHEACLARELFEELGVRATIGPEVFATEHAYDDRTVRLHFRRCEIEGDPRPMLGQLLQWAPRASLGQLEFPPADAELVSMLSAEPSGPWSAGEAGNDR
jgi:8-oxo-dGTP diphosphatase